LKKVPSRQDSLENYLYEISNNSDSYVKRMKINFEFYDDSGELIDAENDWINEIKVLAPGEKMSLKAKHWLHKPEGSEEYQGHSASAKAEVTSFSITEKPQE
jgi:hypothetical protein